jgi:hypothetical protein
VRLLDEIEEAEDKVRARGRGASGLLKVTATAAFARRQLGHLIPRFLERYPDIRVQFEGPGGETTTVRVAVPAAPLHAIYPHTRGVAAKVKKVFREIFPQGFTAPSCLRSERLSSRCQFVTMRPSFTV